MSIEKVSFLNDVSFGGEPAKEVQPASKKTPEEIKDGKEKLALALGALAAVGIGFMLIKSGKDVPSELSIEKFKKHGKFQTTDNNGVTKIIAMYKKKPYTGTIKTSNKNGDFDIRYTDGVLQSALQITTKGSGDDAVTSAFQKVYSYDDNGKLSMVKRYKLCAADGKTDFTMADLTNDDNIKNNFVKVEESRLKIGDNKISIRTLSPEYDKILIQDTYFKQDGSVGGVIKGHKEIGKDTFSGAIEEAFKKTNTDNMFS